MDFYSLLDTIMFYCNKFLVLFWPGHVSLSAHFCFCHCVSSLSIFLLRTFGQTKYISWDTASLMSLLYKGLRFHGFSSAHPQSQNQCRKSKRESEMQSGPTYRGVKPYAQHTPPNSVYFLPRTILCSLILERLMHWRTIHCGSIVHHDIATRDLLSRIENSWTAIYWVHCSASSSEGLGIMGLSPDSIQDVYLQSK